MKVLEDGTIEITTDEFHDNPGQYFKYDRIVVKKDDGSISAYIVTQSKRLECTENEDLHEAAAAWNALSQEEKITARTVLFTRVGEWIEPILKFIKAAEHE